MPVILLFPQGARLPEATPVVKKITTIGAHPTNDLVVEDDKIADYHAHLMCDGDQYELTSVTGGAGIVTGGRRKRSLQLEDGSVFQCGSTVMQFRTKPPAPKSASYETRDSNIFRTLLEFSQRLMDKSSVSELLEELIDQVVVFTEATRGFLILLEEGDPVIRVARGLDRRELMRDEQVLSDSIVRRVLDSGEPIVIEDALHDHEFSTSRSVINFRLCSVMCVPLLVQGKILGLIYIGNDNVASKFDKSALEVLTVYATQAALVLNDALLRSRLEDDNLQLKKSLEKRQFGEIIGSCPSMLEIFHKIERVATTDISVLIQGETGTGKELVAQEIHRRGSRAGGPFVVINCAAIPDNLLESELFGHVRGAFTGAVATTRGKFQAADNGTLFLDELAELPLALQVKILRAIQEKQVTKVGETKSENVDIRIVAATNKVLMDEVRAGRFREDLYYRLNVITLDLPPLRERGDDIKLIAQYLLKRYCREFNSPAIEGFAPGAVNAMRRYPWPGNIRELENRIKKAVVFCDKPLIEATDMDLRDDSLPPILPLHDAKERFLHEYIDEVLAINGGNRTKTARDLNVDPRTIFRHLEKSREEEDTGPSPPE